MNLFMLIVLIMQKNASTASESFLYVKRDCLYTIVRNFL